MHTRKLRSKGCLSKRIQLSDSLRLKSTECGVARRLSSTAWAARASCANWPWQRAAVSPFVKAQEGRDSHKGHAASASSQGPLEHAESRPELRWASSWENDLEASLRSLPQRPDVRQRVQVFCFHAGQASEKQDFHAPLVEVIGALENLPGCHNELHDPAHRRLSSAAG